MKVSITDFTIEMEVKNNGIEFEVRDNDDNFMGDMYVTKTGLVWCRGRTTRANGKKIEWNDFITMMNNR